MHRAGRSTSLRRGRGRGGGRGDRPPVSSASPRPTARPEAQTPIKHVVVLFAGEHLLRPLLRHVPARQPTRAGEPPFNAAPGHPDGQRPDDDAADDQPERATPRASTRTLSILDLRPEPRLLGRAEGVRRRAHGQVRPEHDRGGCTRGQRQPRVVMNYFDGNTVTALWNYAQHFAMSDNSYGTGFGPSTPGAFNSVSGQTQRRRDAGDDRSRATSPTARLIGDADPRIDCSTTERATYDRSIAIGERRARTSATC